MDNFYERVLRAKDPDRLFPVRSNSSIGLYAGRLIEEDMQALIGLRSERSMLLLRFINHGPLYDIERVSLPEFNRPPVEQYARMNVNAEEFQEFLAREYSFEPGLVRVSSFLVSDDGCACWVGPLPWHHEQFLADPGSYAREDREAYPQSIIHFLEHNAGVLDWSEEWYALDADGMSSK